MDVQGCQDIILTEVSTVLGPTGVPQRELTQKCIKLGATPEVLRDAMNVLLQQCKVEVTRAPTSNDIMVRLVSADKQSRFANLDGASRLVYQIIEESNNMGIWTRDIRNKSGLQQHQITKILKTLEQRQLIKSVKSIANKKKVYMIYDLEPSREVTGGAWYNDQEFDAEFIQVLYQQCYAYISKRGKASAAEVGEFIRRSGISRVELKQDDVQSLINALVYDEKLAPVADDAQGALGTLFECTGIKTHTSAYGGMPCCGCSLVDDCRPGGVEASPEQCEHFTRWMDSF